MSSALTRAQFAERYGLSTRTVDRLCRKKQLKWYRLGRQVRILPLNEAEEADKKAK